MNGHIVMGNFSLVVLLAAKPYIWLPPALNAIKQSASERATA